MNVSNAAAADRTAYATDPSSAPAPAATAPGSALGFEDFLKLLSTQFQQQDPMKPMDDTAFIAQMAQFSSLQQSSTLVSEMSQFGADQQHVIANGYLGRTVTVQLADGTSATGDVTAIETVDGAPQLVVGGQNWPLSSVVRVEPTPAQPTPAP
ncbi:MAG TPA: flagellar hook capping FlgD N-terminal domain-containing protein [Opitutus sp.]|nr:flagellar hook capping FlgD N-terminal domain-containing protein [Opitutus sp.]